MGRHFIDLSEALVNYGERASDLIGQFIDAAEVIQPHRCVEECDDDGLDTEHPGRRPGLDISDAVALDLGEEFLAEILTGESDEPPPLTVGDELTIHPEALGDCRALQDSGVGVPAMCVLSTGHEPPHIAWDGARVVALWT